MRPCTVMQDNQAVCHILSSFFECFEQPCYCTLRSCMFTASLLQSFVTLSCIATSSAFNFQPAPQIFLRNHCSCNPRALVLNSIIVVAAHRNEFICSEDGHWTYIWDKFYCLAPFHSTVATIKKSTHVWRITGDIPGVRSIEHKASYFIFFMCVHRCGAGGSMHVCHAAGLGSIPGRDKFPGYGFFRVFSSPVRQMSGSFRPPRSPNIIWPSLSSIINHYGRQ